MADRLGYVYIAPSGTRLFIQAGDTWIDLDDDHGCDWWPDDWQGRAQVAAEAAGWRVVGPWEDYQEDGSPYFGACALVREGQVTADA